MKWYASKGVCLFKPRSHFLEVIRQSSGSVWGELIWKKKKKSVPFIFQWKAREMRVMGKWKPMNKDDTQCLHCSSIIL